MESRELFLSLHLLPFHWVEGWGGSDKKASLSLSYSLARLFILQTDTMFQKLCPSCSHASLLGVSKKGLFSNSSLSPSFFFFNPGEEGWSGGERRAGHQSTSLFPLKSLGPPPSPVRAPAPDLRCRAERSIRCQLKWAAYETAALTGTTSQRWNGSSPGLSLQGSCGDSSLTRPPPPKWNTLLSEAPWGRIQLRSDSAQTLIPLLLWIYLLL